MRGGGHKTLQAFSSSWMVWLCLFNKEASVSPDILSPLCVCLCIWRGHVPGLALLLWVQAEPVGVSLSRWPAGNRGHMSQVRSSHCTDGVGCCLLTTEMQAKPHPRWVFAELQNSRPKPDPPTSSLWRMMPLVRRKDWNTGKLV